jgi:hypothetical protein
MIDFNFDDDRGGDVISMVFLSAVVGGAWFLMGIALGYLLWG